VLSPSPSLVEEIQRTCGVSRTTARVLANRGISCGEKARAFLRADLNDLEDPFTLTDMDVASHRLVEAVRQGEKVFIYGDYDADGVTSTALLYTALAQLGGRPFCYIPERIAEGYGLNSEALARIAQSGARLVVALDCGIRSCEEVEFARSLGMEVIILDHHLPGPTLPAATAVVCPKREEPGHPLGDLASVGLAFKLGEALCSNMGGDISDFRASFLDLAALGTLADIVPLCGENRTLAKRGLEALGRTRKPGLIALIQAAGPKTISEREVVFGLVPRLNAAGRVRHARLAVNLLLARDQDAANRLAAELERANSERQKEQRKVQREAAWLMETEYGGKGRQPQVIVIWGEGWHEGVLGIVASRLTNETGCPTIVLTVKEDEAKGSARSIPGFNVTEALERCSHLLLRCGGHSQAAGLSLLKDNLPAFRDLINEVAREMMETTALPESIQIDASLPLAEADLRLLGEVEGLAPFGAGNAAPVFMAEGVVPWDIRRVGADKSHLTFKVVSPEDKTVRRCVAFGAGSLELKEGRPVSVCFHLLADDFGNGLHPQLEVVDIKVSP